MSREKSGVQWCKFGMYIIRGNEASMCSAAYVMNTDESAPDTKLTMMSDPC